MYNAYINKLHRKCEEIHKQKYLEYLKKESTYILDGGLPKIICPETWVREIAKIFNEILDKTGKSMFINSDIYYYISDPETMSHFMLDCCDFVYDPSLKKYILMFCPKKKYSTLIYFDFYNDNFSDCPEYIEVKGLIGDIATKYYNTQCSSRYEAIYFSIFNIFNNEYQKLFDISITDDTDDGLGVISYELTDYHNDNAMSNSYYNDYEYNCSDEYTYKSIFNFATDQL